MNQRTYRIKAPIANRYESFFWVWLLCRVKFREWRTEWNYENRFWCFVILLWNLVCLMCCRVKRAYVADCKMKFSGCRVEKINCRIKKISCRMKKCDAEWQMTMQVLLYSPLKSVRNLIQITMKCKCKLRLINKGDSWLEIFIEIHNQISLKFTS